jgi:glucose 1-dehydrogenase
MRFDGRTAVVTGGANGIGRALALALASEGAETWVIDADREGLDALGADGRIKTMRGDFAIQGGEEIAGELLEHVSCPDLIVNNVGIFTHAAAMDVDTQEWETVIRVNLTGPFFFSQRLATELRRAERRAAMVMISSLHAERVRGAPHYSASKAGLEIAAKELARDLADSHIRVNIVRPGWIDTRLGALDDCGEGYVREAVPQKRRGTPQDLTGVTLALLDDEVSGYVTGAVVAVDGGLSLYSWT